MDDASRQKFDEIVSKEPAALTPGDIDFLRARASYLSPAQNEMFAEVLGMKQSAKEPDQEDDE